MKKGTLICFVGVDGSGKTTHAKNLQNYLMNQGRSSKYMWCGWRRFEFFLFKPIIEFIRILKNEKTDRNTDEKNRIDKNEKTDRNTDEKNRIDKNEKTDRNTDEKNRIDKNEKTDRNTDEKNRIDKNEKIDYLHYFAMVDYLLRVIPNMFTSLYRYDYIIADRYIFDVIVGFSVNNSENIFKKISWIFPKPDMIFYIDIPENIAYSRKNDIPSIEYLQKRKSIYKKFMEGYNFRLIDGTKSIDEISHIIQHIIREG